MFGKLKNVDVGLKTCKNRNCLDIKSPCVIIFFLVFP